MADFPHFDQGAIDRYMATLCKACGGRGDVWTGQVLGGQELRATCICIRRKRRAEYDALDGNAKGLLALAGSEPPQDPDAEADQ